MKTIDQIIETLNCFTTKQHKCAKCLFNPHPGKEWTYGCIRGQNEVIEAAQKALLTMRPRVLRLDELKRPMVVWLEDKGKSDVVLAIGGSSSCGAKCFITQHDMSIAPLDADYGKRWRAWTKEPTTERKEATPWDMS